MQFHYNNHITIGFAGKRKHEKLDIVAGQLELLFKAFDKKLNNHHLHFVTGLADGADLIATDVFLKYFEGGIKENKRSCGALLPFEKTAYLHTISNKKEFERLYKGCNQVLELDGKNDKGKTPAHILDRAYQQQGRVLGYVSDIFLAVTPKSDKGKMGGTKESLISVLTLDKPVILLNMDDGKFYLYQTLEEWFGEDVETSPEQIAELLLKFEPKEKWKEGEGKRNKLMFLLRKKSWIWFENFFKEKKKTTSSIELPLAHALQAALYKKQLELDNEAAHCQYQYRGGYVLTYILALIAVFLAITSLAVFSEMYDLHKDNSVMVGILIVIGVFKLLIIIAMLINTRNINKSAYNQRAIYYRYAAERLRINYFMSILGVVRSPRPNLGNHSKKHFAYYKGETIYQNNITPHLIEEFKIVITKDLLQKFLKTIRENWIESQKKYHQSAMTLMGRMDKYFRHIPAVLSIGVLVIVSFDILAAIFFASTADSYKSLHDSFDHRALPILLWLTAFFPAVIGTLNGIHSQSETHRLWVRSQSMFEELEAHIKNIDDSEQTIERNKEGSDFFNVLKMINELANVFTDEVAEWSLLYEKRVEEQ